MVKFGEIFKDLVFADWAEGYIMYHHLKPLVKRMGLIMGDRDRVANLRFVQRSQEDAEEAFWLALEQEIKKASDFYLMQISRVEEHLSKVTWAMDKVKKLQEFLIDEGLLTDFLPNGLYGPKTLDAMAKYRGGAVLPDASPSSLDEIANFYATLDRLQEFVILNYVVIAKIVKKYIKNAKSDAMRLKVLDLLPDLPIFATPGLVDLMCKAEALVAGDVAVGTARVMEGEAWIESRVVYSRIMSLAARAEKEVSFPPLPFTVYSRSKVDAEPCRQQCASVAEDCLTTALKECQSPVAHPSKSSRKEKWSSGQLAQGSRPVTQEAESKQRKVYKVALTGGPCAGKTSSLTSIADYFRGLGWRVYVAKESASIVLGGGVNFANLNSEQIFEVQLAIVRNMMTLESSYEAICMASDAGEKCLVVCDRGIMDASVYCDEETWSRVMKSVGLDHSSACDARYDGVLHLVTAADGAEEHYNLESNTEGVRTETAEQARHLDKRTHSAWRSHPWLTFIDNSTDFNNKVKRAVAAICGVVGEQAPNWTLRRRKFLVSAANLRQSGIDVTTSDCDYTYLVSTDGKQHRLRRRVADGGVLYTHIKRSVNERGETMDVKCNIGRRSYLELLSHQDPDRLPIRVVRQAFVWKHRHFCLNNILCAASSSNERQSPRTFGSIMVLNCWCEDDANLMLPPPEVVQLEKEVTGMLEYSLFYLSQVNPNKLKEAGS